MSERGELIAEAQLSAVSRARMYVVAAGLAVLIVWIAGMASTGDYTHIIPVNVLAAVLLVVPLVLIVNAILVWREKKRL